MKENVSFAYREDLQILKNVNLRVKAGTSIALVGPTGAGKTTIVNILTRFYDVNEGKIKIDGIDIREYTRDSLRSCSKNMFIKNFQNFHIAFIVKD